MKLIRLAATLLTAAALALSPAAAQAADLYWTNTSANTINSVPTAGGASSSVASLAVQPWGIATDGTYFYVANPSGIARVTKDGATKVSAFATSSAAGTPMNVAVNASYIYWTQDQYVIRAPITGGAGSILVTDTAPTNGIALDDTYVYWTTGGGIGRAQLNGDGADPGFVSTIISGGGLVAHGDYLYFTGGSDVAIGRVAISGGIANDIWVMPGAPVNAGLATDGTYLYWTDTCIASSGCLSTTYRGNIGRVAFDTTQQNDSYITGAPNGYGIAFAAIASQTITFAQPANTAVNKGPVTLSATSSAGLPVTLTSSTPTVCTVAGTTATLVSVGTCTIEASQAGNATTSAAASVTQSFSVTALPGALATLCPTGSCAGKNLDNVDLTNADLSNVNFSGANFTAGTNLTGANLSGANLTNVIADNASFANANFTAAVIVGIKATSVNFSGAKFSSTQVMNNSFSNSNFTRATFANATVIGSVFSKCQLPFSLFVDTKLFRSGVQLRAKSKITTFKGANLKGATFQNVDARQVNFSKANLTKAKFLKGDVSKANFKGAKLKGAKFKGTKKKGAKGL